MKSPPWGELQECRITEDEICIKIGGTSRLKYRIPVNLRPFLESLCLKPVSRPLSTGGFTFNVFTCLPVIKCVPTEFGGRLKSNPGPHQGPRLVPE